MMGELGRWVRSAACGAMARLLDDERVPDEFVMWVNVSSAELTTGYCDELASTLTLTVGSACGPHTSRASKTTV